MSGVIRGPVALIEAREALILATVLEPRNLRDGLSMEQLLGRMGLDVAQIELAMKARKALAEVGARLPHTGSAAACGSGVGLRSEDMVDTAQAAVLLSLSERRVRDLANELDGTRTRHGWRFPRAVVVARAARIAA